MKKKFRITPSTYFESVDSPTVASHHRDVFPSRVGVVVAADV